MNKTIKVKKSDKEILAAPYIVSLNVKIEEVLAKTKRLDGLDDLPNTQHNLAIDAFLGHELDALAFRTLTGKAYQIVRKYHRGDLFNGHIYNIVPMMFNVHENTFYPIDDENESDSVFFVNHYNDILVYADLLDGTKHSFLDVLVEVGIAFTSEHKVFIPAQKKNK